MLWLEFSLVAFVLVAGASIVYWSLKMGISPMPSSAKACGAIVRAVGPLGKGAIVDLGSGWGTLAIALARAYPERQVVGYEVSFFPWWVSVLQRTLLGIPNLSLYRKNFLQQDLSQFSVLVCYLFPRGMALLEQKLRRELRAQHFLVSHLFALHHAKHREVIYLDDRYKTPVYTYSLDALKRASGASLK